VLAVVPALLVRRAATNSRPQGRLRDYAALGTFNAFWLGTQVAPHLWHDDIVYDFIICVMLAVFLVVWIAAWIELPWRRPAPSGVRAPPVTSAPPAVP
jgi:hypothetical protein